ncbi:beta-glucosidase [Saccharicrinis carchari]|uniref:Beta-glucosidase n=1 Tax=Saccharicrinis carchari TaxID=1168039 RepID=A0A521DD95_SACCC|nr:glycoside hydrolase family 3 C-terminal domain-containing protein [Saccharicrinis carchari]SMO69616.1 beta-glucosidase [Saccharicrinis carchari]
MKQVICLVISVITLGVGNIIAQTHAVNVEDKIEAIISQLSLEEKVKMCHAQSKFSSPGVERLGIPELWMSDGPHGVRAEIAWDSWDYAGWTNDSCTAFPALTALASTFNPDLAYKYGVAIGQEARYRKKDILLGPGVNIYRTPLNGRNFEYLGEDPYLASVMSVPYIKGVQTNGVAACVKHFALNNQEVWRSHINVTLSDRALHEIYLPAFKAAVQEGEVWSVMGAYNKYNGQHTSHHEVLINQILKGDWSFDGVVVTDWGSAHDTKEAALNGLDIEMGTGTDGLTTSKENAYDYYYLAKPFLEMIRNGDIDESIVDDKVRRILRLMFRTNMDKSRPFGSKANAQHFEVAREVAQEGIVLLKNTKDFFPINPETEQTIAVIGENATRMMTVGGGSSELKTVYEISPLEGIQKRFVNANVIHTMGYASGPSQYGRVIPSSVDADSLKKAAIELAKKADLVLFVGGLNKNHEQDCENGDRKGLNLPFGQDELLNDIMDVNKNVGVILVSGNAVAMPWQEKAKAIVQTWYLGSEAGYALADILSGDVNPSGKLPFSFPVKLEDNGAHAFDALSYPGDGINQVYKEDILVGYRWHDTKNIKPLFAFGHGLSYTTFKVNNIVADNTSYNNGDVVKLSVVISNVGKVRGAEVLQVYVHDEKSSVMRPAKELKAFSKVNLEAGERKTVELSLPVDSFAFYDEEINDWNLEKGVYQLMIGTASNNIKKTIKVNID